MSNYWTQQDELSLIKQVARNELALVRSIWPDLQSLPPVWIDRAFERCFRDLYWAHWTLNVEFLRAVFIMEIAGTLSHELVEAANAAAERKRKRQHKRRGAA